MSNVQSTDLERTEGSMRNLLHPCSKTVQNTSKHIYRRSGADRIADYCNDLERRFR